MSGTEELETRPRRALVVDDSPALAETLQVILEADGFEVDLETDPDRALARFGGPEPATYDVVLTDILMPAMSGHDLCRAIKASAGGRGVPVVLVTALEDPLELSRGFEAGADSFIPKPVDSRTLITRVRSVLEKRWVVPKEHQLAALLKSTFEEVVQANRELKRSQAELSAARDALDDYALRRQSRARASDQKWASLLERADDAVFLLDERRTVIEVNRRGAEILGRAHDAIVGRRVEEFVTPMERADLAVNLGGLIARSSIRVNDIRFEQPDGTRVSVDISAAIVEDSGEKLVLAIARDVTERNRLERQLHQAQKMEAIGQLASGAAHDFNNLLMAVLGYADLIVDRADDPHAVIDAVEEIRKAGERAAELTQRLLGFSRQRPQEAVEIDLNMVVADMEKLLRRLVNEDVDLVTRLAPGVAPVRAEAAQVEQVLVNLVVNARDAMPSGGRITIETEALELDGSRVRGHQAVRAGRYVMLAVSDNGCGMDAETQSHLFEPFFTTKPVGKGTGLGLATVYGILKRCGGYIFVYSERGRGSTFKVYFPESALRGGSIAALVLASRRGAASAGAQPAAAALPRARGGETVLVVDDEEFVRAPIREMLAGQGYQVLEARDGREGAEVAERFAGQIQLVVTDMVMPNMNGLDLARRLRAGRPEIAVVFMSGYTSGSIDDHIALEREATFLQKPFSLQALARTVRDALDARAGAPGAAV